MPIARNGDSLLDDTGAIIGSVLFGPDHSVTFMAACALTIKNYGKSRSLSSR
jgi:hypothetical protein